MEARIDDFGDRWTQIPRDVAFALANAEGYEDSALRSLESHFGHKGCRFGSNPRINGGAKTHRRWPTWAICLSDDLKWWFRTINTEV